MYTNKQIWSVSYPILLSLLAQNVINVTDTAFLGRVGEVALGASAMGGLFYICVFTIAFGFSTGSQIVIARRNGEGRYSDVGPVMIQGVMFMLLMALLLFSFTKAFGGNIMRMLVSSESIYDATMEFLDWRIYGFFFSFINVMFRALYIGITRTKVLTINAVVMALTNVVLDYAMIFGHFGFPEMGIKGAALATGIGQTVTLVIYLLIFILRPLSVHIHPKYWKADKKTIGKLYAIGIPATLNMALPSLLISLLNAILAAYSEVYILVLGIYYKLQTFLYLPANGIIQGMRPVIGFNYGAKEHKRVQQIYRIVLIMNGMIMLFGTIICLVIPDRLIGLFTTNPDTIRIGQTALRIISLGFLFSTFSITASGALEGLGKGIQSLIISLCRYLLFIIPAAFILSHLFGAVGVWHAFWIAELFTAFVAIALRHAIHE